MNVDGFVPGLGPGGDGTMLLVFGGDLYASNDQGLFRMEDPFTKDWTPLTVPGAPAGPGATPSSWTALGDTLYAWDSDQIWWIGKGLDLEGSNWNPVSSVGLPGSVSPTPWILYQGQIYAYHEFFQGSVKIFQIWRSPDIGKTVMNWELVVTNSFGDPQNNRWVDIMALFDSRLLVGTNTLEFVFGAPQGKDDGGVEMWESSTGNVGSWSQVNVDGFGTSIPFPGDPSKNLFTNHVLGSQALYAGQLWVATKSHWGAEIWQYDGSGLSGWQNVTPPWAGPGLLPSDTKRFESMVPFQGELYAAEGFPSANLAKYDGQDWSIVVSGPNPFDPGNTMLASLAVFEDHLYVSAGWPAGNRGDQVWAFGLNQVPVASCQDATATAGPTCTAEASIDDGSYDPDGDPITLSQSPPGPYSPSDTLVSLTVTDDKGASDSCQAVVTVQDVTPPEIACNGPATMAPPNAPIAFTATATDNCGASNAVVTATDCFKFTKRGKRIDKRESCVVEASGDTLTIGNSGGVGTHVTWRVSAVDASGNPTLSECGVRVVNPAKGH